MFMIISRLFTIKRKLYERFCENTNNELQKNNNNELIECEKSWKTPVCWAIFYSFKWTIIE